MTEKLPFTEPEARIAPWGNELTDLEFTVRCSGLNKGALTTAKQTLERYGLCHIVREGAGATTLPAAVDETALDAIPVLDPGLQAIQETLGSISAHQSENPRPSSKLIITDASADPTAGGTPLSLMPHSDGTHLDTQPPVVVLQYLRTPDVGGSLCLVDMARVFQDIYATDQTLFAQYLISLAANDAVQVTKKTPDAVINKTTRFLWKTPQVALNAIACTARFDKGITPSDAALEAYQHVKRLVESDEYRVYVQPEMHDILLIDNWRVVHGRSAYMTGSPRMHRRMWIEKLFPRADIFLGVRPLHSGLLQQAEDVDAHLILPS